MENGRVEGRPKAVLRRIAEPVTGLRVPLRVVFDVAVVEVPPDVQGIRPVPVERVPGVLLDPVGDVVVFAIPGDDFLPRPFGAAGGGVEDEDARVEVALDVRRQDALLPHDSARVDTVPVVLVTAGDQVRRTRTAGRRLRER